MSEIGRMLVGLAVVLGSAAAVKAQGPIPWPTPPGMVSPPIYVEGVYQRINRWSVWDYYGVNRFGSFRPRVIVGPDDAYYQYTGEPFPWIEMYQREWVPIITSTPYRFGQ
ncbi:MAG: hypothetical protein NZ700_01425 [Gemmataceae bacterium]|nr:hypothetical protein [Gemmataceae bacterium]MDW8266789.1 hypothetical protein [Gemmataceae bacterium]